MATWLLVLSVLPLTTLKGVVQASPAPDSVAEEIWAAFQRSQWDTSIRDWVGVESKGRGLECDPFEGDSYDTQVDDEWCYRCSEERDSVRAAWTFYALTLDAPLACRAERFHAIVPGLAGDAPRQIFSALISRLESTYGPGKEPGKPSGDFVAGVWREIRQRLPVDYGRRTKRELSLWETQELQLLVYWMEFELARPVVGMAARHQHLVEAEEAKRPRPHWWKWGRWSQSWDNPLDRRLVKELGDDFPELRWLLLEEAPYPPEAFLRENLGATIKTLLEAAPGVPARQRPVLLLAADRLAARWEPQEPPPSGMGVISKRFDDYELNYVWNHLGSNWAYQFDLLRIVWRDYSATEWGEHAFVMLLNRGWDVSVACAEGEDQFRKVIREAEEFLSCRPNSPLRRDVLFYLAQAYETWWSLSRASIQDSYVDRFRYVEGADEARRRAIQLYEEFVQIVPGEYEADYARHRLPRLKLGIDTNQRRFFCSYD